MTDAPEDRLRHLVRAALADARIRQVEVSRQLGISPKHLNQMLKGHVRMSLTWAEGILGLCGQVLVISIQPDRDPHAGPLIIGGRECGGAAWDEPKETP